jgi:demethylmenaquinone methyltransferase/2-methoxy-6-polyprenyl-1,4-benzoquinol methylase
MGPVPLDTVPTDTDVDKAPRKIAGMFDAIAGRYDLLNHLLSGGLDRRWRRRAARELRLTGRERVLDMCTGTGDLAIEAVTTAPGAARDVVGIDFAGEMLRLARAKIERAGLLARIHLARGDATQMPLPDLSCDAAMVAFGIRNVIDPLTAAREFYRVLIPGGRLAVLEFGSPTLPGLRSAYEWYFRQVLPRIGRLISRHGEAYSYLPASVAQFPSPHGFAELLRRAGFARVRPIPLTFGIVYLYLADKAAVT